MPKLKPCSPSKHVYKPTQDIKYEKCDICKDVFPCKRACEHFDCRYVRGEDIPEYWQNLLAAMGLEMNTNGLVPWSERDGGSKAAGRNRRNVRKLRQEGGHRAGDPVAELEHDNSLVRDLSRSGGEVTFSGNALEEGLADGLGPSSGDVGGD